jgi:hypothetical protein
MGTCSDNFRPGSVSAGPCRLVSWSSVTRRTTFKPLIRPNEVGETELCHSGLQIFGSQFDQRRCLNALIRQGYSLHLNGIDQEEPRGCYDYSRTVRREPRRTYLGDDRSHRAQPLISRMLPISAQHQRIRTCYRSTLRSECVGREDWWRVQEAKNDMAHSQDDPVPHTRQRVGISYHSSPKHYLKEACR